ncbi:hypothetical protein SAMN04489761_0588 [Tenacibaculum sp. MAR_2009_124]|nr:hypothetical protein SAMN04489761_0588 [Tenacibaculum sp. MAR_2009_124]
MNNYNRDGGALGDFFALSMTKTLFTCSVLKSIGV